MSNLGAEVRDEIMVLKEIYQKDFEMLETKGAWNQLQFTIIARVNASTSTHSYGIVKLQFTLPKTYPKVPASAQIISSELLTDKNKKSLQEEIVSFIRINTGRILCFDLVSVVQDSLLKFGPFHAPKSFYDAMTERETQEKQKLQAILHAPNEIISTNQPQEENKQHMVRIERAESIHDAPGASWVDNQWFLSFLSKKEEEKSEEHRSAANERSRYVQEFQEISLLGQGAGGEVWKCRHRLDDRLYAIKIIKLDVPDEATLYREVRWISGLLHKNVVRYYSAWIETYSRSENRGGEHENSASESRSNSIVMVSNDLEDDALWNAIPQKPTLNQFDGHDFLGFSDDEVTVEDEFAVQEEAPSKSDILMTESGTSGGISGEGCLYIQMEYCKATLRNIIDEGTLYEKPSQIFHLLRQILDALGYIHKEGIVHRDLKPANIFLDGEGSIKVGDFGLATSLTAQQEHVLSSSSAVADHSHEDLHGSLTAGIGTALYRAPEYEHESAKRENADKADMYSLGIILFEMVYPPFATGMGRVKEITLLRETGHVQPVDAFTPHESLKRLIEQLVQRDPAKRPSAADLLQSPLLPPRAGIDKAYLNEVLTALVTNANQDVSTEIIRALFKRRELYSSYDMRALRFQLKLLSREGIWTDPRQQKGAVNVAILALKQGIEDLLASVFHRVFGAVRFAPLLLQLMEGQDPEAVQSMIEPGGKVIGLPTDLITPFAQYAGRCGLPTSATYSIDRIYSPIGGGQHPAECTEAVVHFVSTGSRPESALQAEALECAIRILKKLSDLPNFQNMGRKFCIRVGDSRLLDCLLDLCEVSESHRSDLRAMFASAANTSNMHHINKELLSLGLSEIVSKVLQTFLDLVSNNANTSKDILEILNGIERAFYSNSIVSKLKKESHEEKHRHWHQILRTFSEAFQSLKETLLLALHGFSRYRDFCDVSFDFVSHPSNSCRIHPHPQTGSQSPFSSSGFHFVLCYFASGTATLSSTCFGEAGHFEPLIYKLRSPSIWRGLVQAVGLRISVDRLLRLALRPDAPFSAPSTVDVLILQTLKPPSSSSTSGHTGSIGEVCHVDLLATSVLHELRNHELRPLLMHTSESDAAILCENLKIPFLIKLGLRGKTPESLEATIRFTFSQEADVVVHSIMELTMEILRHLKSTTKSVNVPTSKLTSVDTSADRSKWEIIFVDKAHSNRKDKAIMKQTVIIEQHLLGLFQNSTVQSAVVLVADTALIELRDFGSCVMKQGLKRPENTSMEQFIESREMVRKSLRNLYNELLRKIAAQPNAEHVFILYSSVDDEFDLLQISKINVSAMIKNKGK